MPEMMDGMSMNLEQANMDKLRAVFPECFAEGKLDIDKLLALCGEYIGNDFEKYKFEWKGKAECLKLAQKRSAGTLRPCPEESVDWDTTQNLYIEGDNLEVLKLLQTAYYRKVKMIYLPTQYIASYWKHLGADGIIFDSHMNSGNNGYNMVLFDVQSASFIPDSAVIYRCTQIQSDFQNISLGTSDPITAKTKDSRLEWNSKVIIKRDIANIKRTYGGE